MAMKTANDDVYFRIKSAASLRAAGIRLGNKEMELKGVSNYAAAFVENAILVHSENLSHEARVALAKLLFSSQRDAATNADQDATADAEETAAEIEADAALLRAASTPFDLVRPSELPPETLYDPDNEFEDDEDDYEEEDLDDDDEA